jgi:UTP--glucose-1-phosphate uridylyltransferase
MKVTKAVITAAGRDQRALPLQTLIDRDGIEKRALRVILEEAFDAGVEEACLVVAPGDREAYRDAAGDLAGRLHFAEQARPAGYGHALGLARDFTGSRPFLHLVSDHLYISRGPARCARQVVEQARAEGCSVSAVQATRESLLPLYGAVGGRRVAQRADLYEVDNVLEKPTPSTAEQELIVPGLRAGHYLCTFGIHVFTPLLMELLGEVVREAESAGRPAQLSPALARLARGERYLALEVRGTRYNTGIRYGLLTAQLAFALDGADRESVLAGLVELLALREGRPG